MNGFTLPSSRTTAPRMVNNRKANAPERNGFQLSIFVFLFMASPLLSPAAPSLHYTVSVLNIPGSATSMNSTGTIIGQAYDSTGASYGYIYQNGTITKIADLPPIPDGFPLTNNFPTAINNAGQVIGFCYDSNYYDIIGYLRNADGTMIDFYDLTGSINCPPSSINNSGTVVGLAGITQAEGFVFQNGAVTYLGSYQGFPFDNACFVNDSGQILATYEDEVILDHGENIRDRGQRAVLITGNEMRSLGIVSLKYGDDLVIGMNNEAEVIGRTGYPDSYPAFFYFSDHLHVIGEWAPAAINNAGLIVGQTLEGSPTPSPALIYTGGKLQKLDDLIDPSSGFSIYSPVAINDQGQILALCTTQSAPSTYLNCLLIPSGQ